MHKHLMGSLDISRLVAVTRRNHIRSRADNRGTINRRPHLSPRSPGKERRASGLLFLSWFWHLAGLVFMAFKPSETTSETIRSQRTLPLMKKYSPPTSILTALIFPA